MTAGVPALVGVALVYGGYHWLSDVLAGWILGPLLLTLIAAFNSGRTSRLQQTPIPGEGQSAAGIPQQRLEPSASGMTSKTGTPPSRCRQPTPLV
jgi:membrane-associated phospholipid phosphatase